MARPKGSRNKQTDPVPYTAQLQTEDRLMVLANLISEVIAYDLSHDKALLAKIKSQLP